MSDDKLLKDLAAAARKDAVENSLDLRWDRYSAGELDQAEVEQLRKDSVAKGEPAGAQEAFRPLGADFARQLAGSVKQQLDTVQGDTLPANTVRFPSPKKRFLAPLALAASLLVAVGITLVNTPDSDFAPLPGYTAALQGGSDYRSGEPQVAVPVFSAGDRLELRLTPATSVEGPVRSIVVLSDSQSKIVAIPQSPGIEIAPSGAARLVAQIGSDLMLDPGAYQLSIAIGRDRYLPSARVLNDWPGTSDAIAEQSWQAWRFDIRIAP